MRGRPDASQYTRRVFVTNSTGPGAVPVVIAVPEGTEIEVKYPLMVLPSAAVATKLAMYFTWKHPLIAFPFPEGQPACGGEKVLANKTSIGAPSWAIPLAVELDIWPVIGSTQSPTPT
jgi:hypothetical protein